MTENGRKCRIGFAEVSGEAGPACGNSMKGPRNRVCVGSGSGNCMAYAVGIVFSAHVSLKPTHPERLTGEDSCPIRVLKAGQ